ncbi:MAG: enoyl-CoA hydratase-related protein [Planctomycetales bacterium]|nr:enoyl-CoA hydratase-related protein [Planctomycetales bacterium]
MLPDTPPVHVQDDEAGALLRLVLDAPKGNVLDLRMIEALAGALRRLPEFPEARLVLLEGAGSHFSFGASVPEHRRETAPALLRAFHALVRLLLELPRPTAAAVRGQCLGAGMELASCCDLVFASADARFGQPESKLGVLAPVASLVLPRLLPPRLAADLLLSGRSLLAEEARAAGFVTELAEDPVAAGRAYVRERLLPLSASSLGLAARAARGSLLREVSARLPDVEALYLDTLMATADANEGIEAFLGRRSPAWRHA